jgi:hypothetical protein
MRLIFNLGYLVSLIWLGSCGSVALCEINHISAAEIRALQGEFHSSSTPSIEDLRSSSWNCSIVGVQSALQKLDRINLYSFLDSAGPELSNHGAHAIKSYRIEKGKLRGINSDKSLIEDLRINQQQELLGRLSKADGAEPASDLAYSKCKQL